MILLIIGGIILCGGAYIYCQSRVETIQHIIRALVWKSLSVAFSNMNESDDTNETASRIINLFKTDMELLNKISIRQFLFSDIPSLLSVEAQKAINEYSLALNSVKVR